MIINLHLDPDKDPNEPDAFVESERSREARQKQLSVQADQLFREAKRSARLDRYFSKNPPNGRLLDIFREALAEFKNTNGEYPRWLAYEQLEASFARLQRDKVLAVEITEDSLGVKTIKSHVTAGELANRRNVRPAELDALIHQLKQAISDALQQPAIPFQPPIHGCRFVASLNKWRVSLYFGGAQRALGCYPFETAIRLQDILAYYFSVYRRPVHYNTSKEHAKDLLVNNPAIMTFCTELEKLWLDAGILVKPGETPIDKTAARLDYIEQKLCMLLDWKSTFGR